VTIAKGRDSPRADLGTSFPKWAFENVPAALSDIHGRLLRSTAEQRDAKISFGAVEFGYQTLDKLARHLGGG
jgi:hypothetical protein